MCAIVCALYIYTCVSYHPHIYARVYTNVYQTCTHMYVYCRYTPHTCMQCPHMQYPHNIHTYTARTHTHAHYIHVCVCLTHAIYMCVHLSAYIYAHHPYLYVCLTHVLEKATVLQYSCLENPRDRGAW